MIALLDPSLELLLQDSRSDGHESHPAQEVRPTPPGCFRPSSSIASIIWTNVAARAMAEKATFTPQILHARGRWCGFFGRQVSARLSAFRFSLRAWWWKKRQG